MISRARCRGFSLLEVIVAFTILAMVLGALFQTFSSGLRAAETGDRYTRAVVIAQSMLATYGADDLLIEGVTDGMVDDEFRWRVTISPYVDSQMQGGLPTLTPLLVDVAVYWEQSGTQRTISVKSMMLGHVRQ